MRTFHSVAEVEAAVGRHLGYSEWHEINQEQIDQFAHATGDHQWIHVDPPRAVSGPFGAPIAHGFLTLSLLPILTWQVYTIDGVSVALNYGANKLRFPAPVPVGSRVRAGVELTGVVRVSVGYQVATGVTIELENAAKPACVVEMLAVVVP